MSVTGSQTQSHNPRRYTQANILGFFTANSPTSKTAASTPTTEISAPKLISQTLGHLNLIEIAAKSDADSDSDDDSDSSFDETSSINSLPNNQFDNNNNTNNKSTHNSCLVNRQFNLHHHRHFSTPPPLTIMSNTIITSVYEENGIFKC